MSNANLVIWQASCAELVHLDNVSMVRKRGSGLRPQRRICRHSELCHLVSVARIIAFIVVLLTLASVAWLR
jgi:hypothetical protein